MTAGAALLGASACRPAAPRADPAARPDVRLVLFVVVDQMRADYLERFRPLFSAGLAQLLAESVGFTAARHDHAVTTTAPGHATLATGLYPSHHGVINNGWWDAAEGDWVYAADDEKFERSPRRLLGSALGDWAKRANRRSKVFAASAKDRSAIFLGGLDADAAFWVDQDNGELTSSGYYRRGKPSWLEAFNDRRLAAKEFGRGWRPLPLPPGAPALSELGVEVLDRGLFPSPFPHVASGLVFAPDESFFDQLSDTPFADRYLARFATALIDGERLGSDGDVDLLAVSFSAVDTVGHTWGPNSPEMVDALLSLDLALGELLAAVDEKVGREHVLVSLSADHGVLPLPEYQQLHGQPGQRIDPEGLLCLQSLGARLEERFDGTPILNPYGYLLTGARAAGTQAEIEAAVRELAGTCPGVERVWTRSELESKEAAGDPMGRLYQHSFHPRRSPDLMLQFEAGFLPLRTIGTTHGSPYDYDALVPWLLRLPEARPASVAEPVATVDVAPTLATLAGIPVPPDRDGVERTGLLPRSPSP